MATKAPPAPVAKQNQPPDEKFWVKYSPHHELPISGMASLAWHTLAVVLIVAVAWVVAHNSRDDMPIEMIQLGNPGGGGGPNGVGNGPGDGRTTAGLVEAARSELPADAKMPEESLKDISGIQITPRDLLDDVEINKDFERELLKITERGTQTAKKLADLDARMRKALMGPGQGGPGSGGGKGTGTSTGTGTGDDANGQLNVRTKRKLRWTITFNTQSGGDYLRQLHALGAILAFRTPDGELKCVRDLMQRPVKPVVEDLQKLNRIFWIDDKRESVEPLARAMGLDFVPDQIVALFTYEFEKELLAKELAFRNRKENDILETRFQILIRGTGYVVVVTDQRTF
jgi:hypothetical protein